MSSPVKSNILLLMSGSIACAKATSLISEWRKRGHAVRVACTPSTSQFVGRATLEGLGAEQVFDDVFVSGKAMDHINLARWAQLVIACPATSNLVNKLASGIADDAVTTLWQAVYGTGRPMLLVPAMNTRMWEYPATIESVARLRDWGIIVLPTHSGSLACGEEGPGRMPEPEDILAAADQHLAAKPEAKGLQILITAGGTRETIDSVRYIGNTSSGRTAAELSQRLVRAGHTVTWLGAVDAQRPGVECTMESFSSFRGLDVQLKTLLGDHFFDVVIHAAAVSDFTVSSLESTSGGEAGLKGGKLPSNEGVKIHLKPNPKLLDRIRDYSSNPKVRVIGFKLTHTMNGEQRAKAVARLFQAGVDAVVHNDLGEIGDGHHPYSLYTADGNPVACSDSRELAASIGELLRRAS
jgi:phosphopantothenoylcysteine decarboxylase/phosphopantothenate--cysteine ligase